MNKRLRMSCFSLLVLIANYGFAQIDPVVRSWYTKDSNAKVEIYLATDNKFYGKIVWLKTPLDKEGKPKTDIHNHKTERRKDPLIGLVILKGFKKSGEHKYEDGTIYDPKNGETYSCTINEKGNALSVRGYLGFSLFGRTETWVKAD